MPEIDWRNLPPVDEAEQPDLPADWRPSQTFLKVHDRCDRAAFLYLKYGAGAGSHELNRGSIFHAVVERLTKLALREGEGRVPPEWGKDELLAYYDENPHLQVHAVERDALRYMVSNWCEYEYIDAERVLGVELPFTLEIGDFTIQGHIDRVDNLGGGACEVVDYKTSFAMPDPEEFKQQSFTRDGRPYFAGNFQTMLYALGVAEGETEMGRIGADFDRFRLALRFPRFARLEGLATRGVTVTRQQLLDFRLDVEHQLRRLREVNLGEGRWQATPGTHCAECPCEYDCPLPRLLRPESQHASLDSLEDLEAAAANRYFMSRRAEKLGRRLKKAALKLEAEQPGVLDLGDGVRGVRCGNDNAYIFVEKDGEEVRDKAELQAAIEASNAYGEKIDTGEHFKPRVGTEFLKRKIPAS
jgi:hypothetical protein